MAWSPIASVRDRAFLPVANGTHFNANGAATASAGLIQTRCRQTRKLLRVIGSGATKLQVEWANIWTTTVPQTADASCEIAGPNAVTCRMSVEYPAGNPRLVSGSAAWSSATAYALLDQVTYSGSSWVCIQAGTNQTPAANSAYWRQVNRYVVNWPTQTDSSGTVVFAPGDYRSSLPIALSERTRTGDCIAVLGAFDTGSSTNYMPYAGANGACNTAPFVDWVIDVAGGLPTVGTALPDTGITNQTNGNTTTASSTDNLSWMKIPYATAITGNIPQKRCVAIFGDSLVQGYGGDIRDGEPCGIFPRALDGTTWWRIAQSGNRAQCYAPGNAPWQTSVIARCTAVLCNLALDDISSGATSAQLQSYAARAWQVLAAIGPPLYIGSFTPISASSDAWATTTNQSRYTASGTIATTQYPTDDASYLTSVYGVCDMWITQDGAPIATPDGATVKAGQVNHPVEAILDWRGILADPATSWKWVAGFTTDGTHPAAAAAPAQAAYLTSQLEPVVMGRQQIAPYLPAWSPLSEAAVQSMSRSDATSLSTTPITGSLMGVVGVSPGRYFYGLRLLAGTSSSKSFTVLAGADAAKMKIICSGTIASVANSIFTISLPGAPVWIPAGQLIAVVVTTPAVNAWGCRIATNAAVHATGSNALLAGSSADTTVLSGVINLISGVKFTSHATRVWVEAY